MVQPNKSNQQAQLGRRVRGLPATSPEVVNRAELRRRVEREKQHAQEKQALETKLAEAERDKHLLGLWSHVERCVRRRAAEIKLDGPNTTRLVLAVEQQWLAHLAADKPPERFDHAHATGVKVAALTGTLAPAPRSTNPTEQAAQRAAYRPQETAEAIRKAGFEVPGISTPGAFSRPF